MIEGTDSTNGSLARLRRAIALFKALSIPDDPLITVITPAWNTQTSWFLELTTSLFEQSFLQWQWCIVDDCSSAVDFHSVLTEFEALANVEVICLTESHGISRATNAGLAAAAGQFVCFVDHDDTLAPHALRDCVAALQSGFDAVYTDSDKLDSNGRYVEPFFKPDWSPEFFRGVMYVGHLLCARRDLALAIGGFDFRYDGVQDFDFMLRYSELTSAIGHVPEILYHWRAVSGSVAASTDAKGDLGSLQQEAVANHLKRLNLQATVTKGDFPHRLKIIPSPRRSSPGVTVIIPTRDSAEILHKCIYNLFSRTTFSNLQVLCVDNETTETAALDEMRRAPVERILFPGKFNFSKANNLAAQYATGEFLVFMNNDVEVITPDWVEQLLYYAEQEDVGAVGPLLLYPDRTVQHAGVVLGCRGTADHVLRGVPGDCDGYAGSLSCAREVSAVTGACLMMRRSVFDEIEGFNEHFFTAYQDVDLCLKLRGKGKRNIFTPRARLIHHESLSRGSHYDFVDRNLLLDLWEPLIQAGDPYFNPNFDLDTCDYQTRANTSRSTRRQQYA